MPNESFDLCFGFLVFSLLEVTEDTQAAGHRRILGNDDAA